MIPSTPLPLTNSGALAPADQLWKFQLRRENKARLEELEAHKKQSDQRDTEYKELIKEQEARLTALEAKIADFEKARAGLEQWRKQIEHVRACSDAFYKTGLMDDVASQAANTNKNTAAAQSQPPFVSQEVCMTEQLQTTSGEPEVQSRNKSHDSASPTRITPLAAATTVILMPDQLPSMVQGNAAIDVYYNEVNNVYDGFENFSTHEEVRFVNLFLQGMRASMRDLVVVELRKLHSSRNRKDASVEILCLWDHVLEGLIEAGLVKVVEE